MFPLKYSPYFRTYFRTLELQALIFLTVALPFEWQRNVLPCLQTLSRIWAPDVAPYLFLGANLLSSLLDFQMRNPAIQNDFSYYRRTISRNRINNMHVSAWDSMAGIMVALWLFPLLHMAEHREKAESLSITCLQIWWLFFFNNCILSCFHQLDIENEVNNEMANRMSLFYAEATPMLKTLSNATMHFVSEVSEVGQHRGSSLYLTCVLLVGLMCVCVSPFRIKPCP